MRAIARTAATTELIKRFLRRPYAKEITLLSTLIAHLRISSSPGELGSVFSNVPSAFLAGYRGCAWRIPIAVRMTDKTLKYPFCQILSTLKPGLCWLESNIG